MFRKIIVYVLLIAVIGLLLNISLFRHFHMLPDGTLIEHAHPFAGSAQSHSHTSEDLILLDLFFKAFQIVVTGILLLTAVFHTVMSLLVFASEKNIFHCFIKSKQPRAPPPLF